MIREVHKRFTSGKRVFAGNKLIWSISTLILFCTNSYTLPQKLIDAFSISHSYDAQNVFVNPAALGFQTELNGWYPATHIGYYSNSKSEGDMSAAISYGYFGLGLSTLTAELDKAGSVRCRRYMFSMGVPLWHSLFIGSSLTLQRHDAIDLSSFDSFDIGLQWRVLPYLSMGALLGHVNQPSVLGDKVPMELVTGITVKPIHLLEASLDVETELKQKSSRTLYQAALGVEILSGIKLQTAYRSDSKFSFRFTWNFDHVSVGVSSQSASNVHNWGLSVQTSKLPYRSMTKKASALTVPIASNLGEVPLKSGFFSPSDDKPSLIELLDELYRARATRHVKTILVSIDSFPLGFASAIEIFEALAKLREQGVVVEVFLRNAGLKEYLIASVANHIYLEHSGELRLLGLKAESFFLKGTLEKLGVEGQFLAKGKYKFAPETFTQTQSSPLNRETTLEYLQKLETVILPYLEKFRRVSPGKWKTITDKALLGAEEARELGLIDRIGTYSIEVEKRREKFHVVETVREKRENLNLPGRIAVISTEGDILASSPRLFRLINRATITPKSIEDRMEQALSDKRTKAIVFRVNSGGGEILASDEIAAMMEKVNAKKPVIVSMGDYAASGGYLISLPCHRLFASRATTTGSIGVFLGKFSLKELFQKIQLNKEIISNAPYPGLLSEDRPWGTKEIEIMTRRLDTHYDHFVATVSRFRELSKNDVEAHAQGRVWLGQEAFDRKLVDEKGGFSDAIHFAETLSGLADTDYELWPIEQSSVDWFEMVSSGVSVSSDIFTLLGEDAIKHLSWIESLSKSPFLYWLPLEVK